MAHYPQADNFIELFKTEYMDAILSLGELKGVLDQVLEMKNGKIHSKLIQLYLKTI